MARRTKRGAFAAWAPWIDRRPRDGLTARRRAKVPSSRSALNRSDITSNALN